MQNLPEISFSCLLITKRKTIHLPGQHAPSFKPVLVHSASLSKSKASVFFQLVTSLRLGSNPAGTPEYTFLTIMRFGNIYNLVFPMQSGLYPHARQTSGTDHSETNAINPCICSAVSWRRRCASPWPEGRVCTTFRTARLRVHTVQKVTCSLRRHGGLCVPNTVALTVRKVRSLDKVL